MPFPPFYPVMPDLDWIKRIAPLGISVVQLRLKEAGADEIERQISGALEVCARYNVQLIVNDYWQEAIRLGADYIHLGQEDLAGADMAAIRTNGIRVGISTHSEQELEIALAARADYIALGPIYETLLKKMKWEPQGLERVKHWRDKVSVPLIAIGGITPTRAPGVLEAGAHSIAVVTDIITNNEPEARVSEWVALLQAPQG